MSLEKEIEDLKKQLSQAAEEEFQPVIDEPAPEPEVQPEVTPEEPAPIVEEPKKEELDDTAYARMRREKAAAEKRARELEERLEALENAKNNQQEEAQPVQEHDPMQELLVEHTQNKAWRELQTLETEFKKHVSDYDGVVDSYLGALAQSIKIQNPRTSDMAINDMVKNHVLYKSAEYYKKGFNPVEELYNEALELGFSAPKPEAKADKPVEMKPDLDRIAANKARNAGFQGASSQGIGGEISRQAAADMSVAEWAKLSPADKKRLMYGA